MATYKGHEEDQSGNILLPVPSDVAPIQTSSSATQSFAVGDYFYYNNQLYKCTSAISSGSTISPGSNCTATTVGAELKNGGSGSSGGIQFVKRCSLSSSNTYTLVPINESYQGFIFCCSYTDTYPNAKTWTVMATRTRLQNNSASTGGGANNSDIIGRFTIAGAATPERSLLGYIRGNTLYIREYTVSMNVDIYAF